MGWRSFYSTDTNVQEFGFLLGSVLMKATSYIPDLCRYFGYQSTSSQTYLDVSHSSLVGSSTWKDNLYFRKVYLVYLPQRSKIHPHIHQICEVTRGFTFPLPYIWSYIPVTSYPVFHMGINYYLLLFKTIATLRLLLVRLL